MENSPFLLKFLIFAAILLIGVPLLILMIKKFFWWLFSFERDVSKILHQKKSSEVRMGKIVEELAPILNDFPVDLSDPEGTLCFLGQPIDYVYFHPGQGVTFIEVKSGESKLSRSQRKLKKSIDSQKVQWKTFRVK